MKCSIRLGLKSWFPPRNGLWPLVKQAFPTHRKSNSVAIQQALLATHCHNTEIHSACCFSPLRDGLPLPFQTEESLLVSSSVQSWRVGNSSVVCSRIYLQAAGGRGKGNEHNSIILNLTSWSWHILYPSPLAMSIITPLPFPGSGFLSMEARPSLKLWFQPSSPLYPLDMWRPLSHQPISAQNKDIRPANKVAVYAEQRHGHMKSWE